MLILQFLVSGFLAGFNRRPPDACLIDMIAGMGCFDWIAGVALVLNSHRTWRCLPGCF